MTLPLDKTGEFPRESLRRNRSERQREVAQAQWNAGPEGRRERGRAVRKGMAQARDKLSAALVQRWRQQRETDAHPTPLDNSS
jgi:hypothetical protein